MMPDGKHNAAVRGGGLRSGAAKSTGSFVDSGRGSTLVTIVAAVIIVAVLAAIPLRGQKNSGKNPAADAEAIRRTLAMQAGQNLEPGKAAIAAEDSTEAAGGTAQAFRDLFNPVRIVRQASPRRVTVSPPRTPRLSGVFLDGGNRIAVLDGETTGEGDEVGGFQVISILADRVVLERAGQVYTLDWKGVQP